MSINIAGAISFKNISYLSISSVTAIDFSKVDEVVLALDFCFLFYSVPGCFIFLLSSHCRPSSWRCSKLQKKTQKQNHRLRDIIYRHCTNLRKGYVKVTLWDTTFKYPFSSTKERGDYNEGVYKQRGKYRHYKELIEQIPWDFSFHKWSYERKRQDEQFFEVFSSFSIVSLYVDRFIYSGKS